MAKSVRTVGALAVIALGLSAGATAFAPAIAQSSLGMLAKLDSGRWEVRNRNGGSARSICVRDGNELIQLRHRGSACNRFVVEDGANEITVQYTCRGNGYGRTHIRRETAGLVQIDSQGIAGGKPFQFAAEARRVGSCR
ncbi:MAG: hypothetical protein MK010_05970 [Erythrobacter sp.]|nr:hypothetical protein [Erythrobacter sp.]